MAFLYGSKTRLHNDQARPPPLSRSLFRSLSLSLSRSLALSRSLSRSLALSLSRALSLALSLSLSLFPFPSQTARARNHVAVRKAAEWGSAVDRWQQPSIHINESMSVVMTEHTYECQW